jgi:hypothetical protein
MSGLILGLAGDFWPVIAGLMAAVGVYFAGKRAAKKDRELKDYREQTETMKRANDAHIADVPADARKWLRDRADKR